MKKKRKYLGVITGFTIFSFIFAIMSFIHAEMIAFAAQDYTLVDIVPINIKEDIKPLTTTDDIFIPTEEVEIDATELRYLSALIHAEAGNQCKAGKQAVGIIVMERVEYEDYFEDNVIDVIYEKGQFKPVENGSLNKSLKLYDEGNLPVACIRAAEYALLGHTEVVYNNTTYDLDGFLFFSRYVKDKRLVIQDHQFK